MADAKWAVFIDASEIIRSGPSPTFAGDLRRMSQSFSVVTSTLMLDEVCLKVEREFKKMVGKLGGCAPRDLLPSQAQTRQTYERYLTHAGVQILPCKIDDAEIARACAKGGKPFNPNGSGANDYIHWVTFVDHARLIGADAGFFLTHNHRDFAEQGKIASDLIEIAQDRGCTARFETMTSQSFVDLHLPQDTRVVGLAEALRNWICIVEMGEILHMMGINGTGPGIELQLLSIRDTEVQVLRPPDERRTIQLIFRVTFDCHVIVDAQIVPRPARVRATDLYPIPWTVIDEAVRLEWTVEAQYDEKRGGMCSIPMQIKPCQRLDAVTGKPIAAGPYGTNV